MAKQSAKYPRWFTKLPWNGLHALEHAHKNNYFYHFLTWSNDLTEPFMEIQLTLNRTKAANSVEEKKKWRQKRLTPPISLFLHRLFGLFSFQLDHNLRNCGQCPLFFKTPVKFVILEIFFRLGSNLKTGTIVWENKIIFKSNLLIRNKNVRETYRCSRF